MGNPYPLQSLKDQFDVLVAKRDEINAKSEHLKAAIEVNNLKIETLRLENEKLLAEISEVRGGDQVWFDLKRHIAVLAKALGAPNGLLATPE